MENTQIAQLVAAYDANVEVHIDDLAELFGMTTETVKQALFAGGSKRLMSEGTLLTGSRKTFTNAMVKRAVATIESCLDSYDDSIRFRAAELIIKVDTGAIGKPEVRNVTNFIQQNLNILDDTIRRGLEAREAARNGNVPRPAHDDVHNRRGLPGGEIACIPVASERTGVVCEPLPEGEFIPA
jgi:hypothetical protein